MKYVFFVTSSVAYTDNGSSNERPSRGTHVDSISYYTYDLADCNKNMYFMQQRKTEIAFSGNSSNEADSWIARLMISAYEVADQIMVDSAEDNALGAGSLVDNALRANYSSFEDGAGIPQAELMSSRYGSFGPLWHNSQKSRTQELLVPLENSPSEEILFSDEDSTATGNTYSSEKDIVSKLWDFLYSSALSLLRSYAFSVSFPVSLKV